MIMGLDRPTTGHALVNGKSLAAHGAPLHEVGALLEAKGVHPGRTARDHLLGLAATTGISAKRVDDVLDLVGLTEVARKRAGAFSLGMGQRLGIAAALLGDPAVVMLDEPVNGLDPEGVLWIRNLMKGMAAEGRTVFVSSHLMSEMAVTADHLVVIGRGRLLADTTATEFIEINSRSYVRIRTPEPQLMRGALATAGIGVTQAADGALEADTTEPAKIGELAAANGLVVHEVSMQSASLEEAFMRLTRAAVDYRGTE
jgi:ABC-2 type transport system ATP-binding protein